MKDQDTDLTAEERDRLRALRGSPCPPEALESRTVDRLYRSGLVARPEGRSQGLGAKLAVAAAIFAAGVGLGAVIERPLDPRFVLLLDEPGETAETAEDDRVSEYAQWARRVRKEGVGISGARLANELEVIGVPAGEASVSGFFLLDVEDEARALQIARSCPHTRYGGSIIVGRILR